MSNQAADTITKFEVMFALRTGVTIMLPKIAAFDGISPTFRQSPDEPRDLIISADARNIRLKGLKKEHVDAAVSRGFIMFYEMEYEDIVRSTLCNHKP